MTAHLYAGNALDQGWLWYPPPEMMSRLVAYTNEHGEHTGRPYYSVDGARPVTAEEWGLLRHTWAHQHGLTNAWAYPPLHGSQRYLGNGNRTAPRVHRPGKKAALHLAQKPLELMRRIVWSCTQPGDILWEPFGGLCSASVAAVELGREPYAAEVVPDFLAKAAERLSGLDVTLEVTGSRRCQAAGEPA